MKSLSSIHLVHNFKYHSSKSLQFVLPQARSRPFASPNPATAVTKEVKMADSAPGLEGSSMHITLTQGQLLAFSRHIQATNPGRPTEEFVREFVQKLHTAQMQTFSQVIQEFQLGQKPSVTIGMAEDDHDDPNVLIEEGDNKWPYAKPAVYVVHEVQIEEALDRKPHHRGKRGGRKSKKSQNKDGIVPPVTSNNSTVDVTSASSNIGIELVEEEICSEALIIFGIYEYAALLVKFEYFMVILLVSLNVKK
jgi:hypothetical protein